MKNAIACPHCHWGGQIEHAIEIRDQIEDEGTEAGYRPSSIYICPRCHGAGLMAIVE